MIFEHLPLAIASPFIGALIGFAALVARRRRIRAASAWSASLGRAAVRAGEFSPAWLALTGLAGALALAGPRWGAANQNAESRALNIVIVMDVSRSMLAQDVQPNRLGRAVSAARRLVLDLDGDRFALVGFAGHSYLLSPLTLDESSIALQLDALDPDMASAGGSGLAGALDLARKTLVASPQGGDRAVVVFSDGESFDGPGPLESAGSALRSAGITLITIPFGETKGARIPEADGSWHRDNRGNVVVTTRRDDLLQAVTTAAGGVFIPANAPDAVGDARRALARLNRAPAADRVASDLLPRAWILALIAFLLLIAHTLTRRTAALAVFFLAFAAAAAQAQRPSAGNRLLSRGDTAKARAAFTADARAKQSDTAWFNAGTSSLMAGDFQSAVTQLQAATLSLDPGLRERALYNLGTAHLMRSRSDSMHRDTLLADATRELHDALLLAPTDRNAKFNYELSRRLKPPPSPQSGPGNKGKGGDKPNQQPPPPPSGGKGGMTQAAAEQVLTAMERAERDTRQHQNARTRKGDVSMGPDW